MSLWTARIDSKNTFLNVSDSENLILRRYRSEPALTSQLRQSLRAIAGGVPSGIMADEIPEHIRQQKSKEKAKAEKEAELQRKNEEEKRQAMKDKEAKQAEIEREQKEKQDQEAKEAELKAKLEESAAKDRVKIEAGTEKKQKEKEEYLAKAKDMDEAIAACEAAIAALKNSTKSVKGAKLDFTQLKKATIGLTTALSAQCLLSATPGAVALLTKLEGEAAPEYEYQSKDIITILENLDATFKKMKKDFDKQSWSTLMLKGLPNGIIRYDVFLLLEIYGFKNKIDFLFVPIDPQTKANKGYAFVNFTSPKVAKQAYACLEGFCEWGLLCQGFHNKGRNSNKICRVCLSKVQGLDANINHHRYSSLLHDVSVPDHKPSVWSNGERKEFAFNTKISHKPKTSNKV